MEGRGGEDKTGDSRQPAGSNSWPTLTGHATNMSLQHTGHLGPSLPLQLACAAEVTPLCGAGDSSGTRCGCIPGESLGAGWGLYPQDLLQGLTWDSSGAEDTGLEHLASGPGTWGSCAVVAEGLTPACSPAAYSHYYADYESGLLFLTLFFIDEVVVSNLCFQTCF